ncbi:MAG: hypothetical protein IK116_00250, partial [Firmicutes bacterium]|nr:hypothetical protein [Bacillota bacterium]
MKRSLCALLLMLGLALCACGGASETPVSAPAETAPPSLPAAATAAPYEQVPVYYNGLLSDRGYRRDGVTYLSPAALAALFDLDYTQELREDSY